MKLKTVAGSVLVCFFGARALLAPDGLLKEFEPYGGFLYAAGQAG